MPWYKCFVAGKDFPGELIGRLSLVGFYTTWFVEAASFEEAELKALDELRRDDRLRLSGDSPGPKGSRIYFEEIIEVLASEVPATREGFVWYADDESQPNK